MRGPIRIVLADDTPEIRLLLRMTLDPDDRFEIVGEARDGEEAVELSQAHKPDAIVLDLAMPVMDGLEAIPQIKYCCPTTKIVVLSGFQAQAMSSEALERGADAYVEKGVAHRQIADAILAVVDAA